MISYKPLQHTLIDKGVKKMELVKRVGMSNSTLSKLNKYEYVALEVLERICLALGCEIKDVVKVSPNSEKEEYNA
jgi:DNA-binding Xre family transcriptional regulator